MDTITERQDGAGEEGVGAVIQQKEQRAGGDRRARSCLSSALQLITRG